MNLDFQAGGSPLASRQNPVIYAVIFVALVVIAVFFLFWLLQKKIKEHRSTPEWLKKETERSTKKIDVDEFAKKYNLFQDEAELLWKICKKYQIQNIIHSIKHFDDIDNFFKLYYDELEKSKKDEIEINNTFRLKFKLEKIFASSEKVSSTKSLEKEQRIAEIFPDGSKIALKIIESKADFLEIAVTEDFMNSPSKPKQMDKVAFTFLSATGMRYAFVSRLLRYENLPNGTPVMLVSHSSDLIAKQQRNFKRININEKCAIASVKIEKDKRGRETKIPSEKKYECNLTNISGGGCCISSNLPVKEGQQIYTEFYIEDETVGAFGKIVKTRKTKMQGVFNLHITFTDIAIENQNKILAKVYGY